MLAFRIGIVTAALMVAALLPSAAAAQDDRAQWAKYIQSHCGKEIRTHCGGVTTGEGRVIACLYAREGKLSATCGNAVMNSVERLGKAVTALANVVRVCEPDTRRLCNGMVAGNGNLVGCLTTARRSVSSQCNVTLDAAFLRP
jgi:hypothetical protein